jgi:hypothetical protein
MNSWWAKHGVALSDTKGVIITIMLMGSLTIIGLICLDKFVDVYNSQASIQTIMDLEQEISQIGVRYRDARPEALQTNLEQAGRHLVQDFTHLTQWAQKLQEQGERISLQMHYQILKPEPTPSAIPGITVIPLELHLSSREEGGGYREFLQFLQALEKSGPHIDIQEITVKGDGQKAKHFTVGLTIWMKTHDSVEL